MRIKSGQTPIEPKTKNSTRHFGQKHFEQLIFKNLQHKLRRFQKTNNSRTKQKKIENRKYFQNGLRNPISCVRGTAVAEGTCLMTFEFAVMMREISIYIQKLKIEFNKNLCCFSNKIRAKLFENF